MALTGCALLFSQILCGLMSHLLTLALSKSARAYLSCPFSLVHAFIILAIPSMLMRNNGDCCARCCKLKLLFGSRSGGSVQHGTERVRSAGPFL